ncbi:MAG TPA: nucleotidyltransferase, partial [Fusibacter sp.]|nr:nucleotidyltransferase [Fusibacter sp.]
MKIIGIVSEYNPFHNGHAYQVQKSIQDLDADGVIAIMSGNFVQRGFPAIQDKWLRAEMAVKAGVNLVIELPTYYATSSAENFAKGAVSLLDATGVVTHLSFGSEFDDLDCLNQIADALINPKQVFEDTLRSALDKGLSYPSARDIALNTAMPELSEMINLNQSNVILGIEYLKALKQLDSSIKPFLVKRMGKGYHDLGLDIVEEAPYVSASAIREAYFASGDLSTHKLNLEAYMPKEAAKAMLDSPYCAVRIEDFEKLILYELRKSTPAALSKLREVSEGLENKLSDASLKSTDYAQLLDAIKSKRYAMTRINRILLNVLLGIEQESFDLQTHGYLRVLAFDATGQKIIRAIKKNGYLPLITNINK